MSELLPYFCPELGSAHLRPPCQANLDKIAEAQEKSKGPYLGWLEKCRECQGEKLQKREAPVEELTESGMKKMAKLAAKGERRMEILQALDRVIKREGRPQVDKKLVAEELGVGADRLTYHLKLLENEGFVGVIPGNPNTPALVGFAEPKNGLSPEDPPPPAEAAREEPPSSELAPPPEKALPVEGAPLCETCGKEPAIIDKLQRNMRICRKCLALRSKKNLALGSAHGWQPFHIPLNSPKYAEIKKWLEDGAEELEQELWQQVMFQLKMAYRRGQGCGEETGA